MAKQRRPAKTTASRTRIVKRAEKKKTAAPNRAMAARKRVIGAPKRAIAAIKRAVAATKKAVAAPVKRRAPEVREPAAPPPPPPAPARKPGFYEAVAIYERGVQALQRHDFQAAAGFFKSVVDGYPEERELLERARLYLRVCERETSRQPAPAAKTPAEHVYAATVALNSGDHTGALEHLQRALAEDPESDHAHYNMAVALGMRGRVIEALDHLRLAIGLNPDNRGLARQDPDLESLRDHESFRSVLDTPPSPNRRRPARRR